MKKSFHLPDELPSGFFEALKPLADWVKKVNRDSYQSGYLAGRADASRELSEIRDRIRKDDRRRMPPTGAAPAFSL